MSKFSLDCSVVSLIISAASISNPANDGITCFSCKDVLFAPHYRTDTFVGCSYVIRDAN